MVAGVVVRTGKGLRLAAAILCAGLLLAGGATAASAALQCRAEVSPATAARGDVVVLTVTAEGDFGWSADFELPAVTGANVAGGGTSQSVSMVNGKTSATVSRTWYLTLTADDKVTVPPVLVRAGGGECRTDPLTITVTGTKGGGSLPPAVTGNRQPRTGVAGAAPSGSARGGKPGDDIFVTLEADHDEAWVGQQIILTFRYCRRIRPWNNAEYTPPRTEGFWREDLGPERRYRRVYAGYTYDVNEMRYALFPTQAGDLVIEPAEVSFPPDAFDRFFGSRTRRRGPRVLRTDSLHVHVREVPTPRPDGFSGLVATSLELRASVSPDSVATGEPVTLKAVLAGDAFLKGFEGLEVTPPDGVRMHDAGRQFDTGIANGRLTGRITLEKILVPRSPGPMHTPPLEVVWFDAGAGRYRTARAELPPVAVGGEDLGAQEEDSGFLRAGLQRMGEDLAFIHPAPRRLRRAGPGFTGSAVWWLLLALPVLLLVAWKVFLDRRAAAGRDVTGRRRRGALRNAGSLLEEARSTADVQEACTLVSRAVRGFAEDLAGVPAGQGDPDLVRDLAGQLGRPEAGGALAEILTHCDDVRFGGTEARPLAELAQQAHRYLEELHQAHKRGSGGRAARILPLLLVVVACWGGGADATAAGTPAPEQLVAEGNQAYTAGDFDLAAQKYLAARDLGVDDPVLHYNLGNAQARRGRLGLAVASYLRASRLEPGDRDIRRNLAFVRSSIRDIELGDQGLPLFIKQLADLVDLMGLGGWGLLLLALVWFLCVTAGWLLYLDDWTDARRRMLVGLVTVTLLVAAATGWRWYLDRGRSLGVIVADTAQVRSGPAESFPVLFEVHDGLTVNLREDADSWRRISLGGDWTGWVPAGDLEPVDRDAMPSAVHTAAESDQEGSGR